MKDVFIIGLHGERGAGKDTAAEALVTYAGFRRLSFADELRDQCFKLFKHVFDSGNPSVKDSGAADLFYYNSRDKDTPNSGLFVANTNNLKFMQWFRHKCTCANFDEELFRPRTARWFMQNYADFLKEENGKNYFVDRVKARIAETVDKVGPFGRNNFVVTDVRYEHEALAVLNGFKTNPLSGLMFDMGITRRHGMIIEIVRPDNPYHLVTHDSDHRIADKYIDGKVINDSNVDGLTIKLFTELVEKRVIPDRVDQNGDKWYQLMKVYESTHKANAK